MTTRDHLDSYIQQLQRRLRIGAVLRGTAIFASVALALTMILVLLANHFAFASWTLTGARLVLLVSLALAIGFGLALPIYGLNRRRAAGKAESVFPQFEQRLVTYAERDVAKKEPFIDLLAADTLEMSHDAQPRQLVPGTTLLASIGIGLASLGVLVWLVLAGPGYLGHGAALIWTGAGHVSGPLYELRVSPGDVAVRRNSDQLITAQLAGLQTPTARLYARFQSASKWEQVAMQPQPGGSGFQFLFAGLPEGVEYYVEAGPLQSRHFNLKVVDLPSVKQIRVTYRFPSWTGLKNQIEEHGGDLRAVEGTQADLEVLTDRPMRDGSLVVDDKQIKLGAGEGNVYKGTVHIDKDGQYHVAANEQGETLRISDDFFIEARKANPPEVRLIKPGGDYRANPIEEVTVAVNADGEFGLNDVAVHYSVNGSDEKTVSMLKEKGSKQVGNSTVLSLEDFKLVPGDVVSVYATAKDARSESRTDMYFIQADPFERQFSQSQQAGGGMGGGGGFGQGDQTDIAQREKEIIAATFKQKGDSDKKPSKQESAENGKFLSGVQAKLRDQALSLAARLQRRELSDANQEFSDFEKDMTAAAAAMAPAAERLQQQKWSDALPEEQKALQHLLRAEATFREIQVAFGARGGGGGAGGAGRDLSSLFDLELDTEKNQYETGQTANSANQRAQEIDEALQKLEKLARRQEELAQQQRGGNQSYQQRWQEEMLRREAEELQRQMEQLARNQQQQQGNQQANQQGGQQQSGQQGGQSQSGRSGTNGQQSANGTPNGQASADNRMQEALDRLRQAQEDMARAASQSQPNDAAARRAAERLQEASNLLSGLQQREASQQMDAMAREADRLQKEEQDQEARMRQMFARGNTADGLSQSDEQSRLADDRQQTGDALGRLEKQMQEAARGLGATQPNSANKLREALGGMEQDDLQSRIKKSADWIRRGIDPTQNGKDTTIPNGMQRLDDQLHQAQQAFNRQQQNPQEALNQIERLRSQMEALARGMSNAAGRNGQQGQPGQPRQMDQLGRNQGGQAGQPGQPGQPGQQGNNQAGGGPSSPGSPSGGPNGGPIGGPRGGTWAGGYGPIDRQWYGGDTGGYWPQGRETQPVPSTPEEIQRAYQEAMRELNALRQSFQGQPAPLADLQELIREMQRLDPSRFPGNPTMLEELHDQVLTSVDKLELRLRRQEDDNDAGQIRSGDSLPVPAGYQDSVADYFRRLSKNPSNNP
ncbi:MAG: hypothetical protein DMG32_17395 [Acidobacteria bacterium]|nr:MAG: hypothetical protein DMG32_17395 [Acidobacteriota bacterium]